MVRKYHEAATESGAVIVPASGLDSVPRCVDSLSRPMYRS